MQNQLYLVDWGMSVQGSRHAIIEGSSYEDAFMNLDSVGDPSNAKLKLINTDNWIGEPFYVELATDAYYYNLNESEDEEFIKQEEAECV